MKLQALFGIIPLIRGKGEVSQVVLRLLVRMRREATDSEFANTVPEIDELILIDRTVDMVTPLLIPHTYEGLLDEILELKNGFVSVDAELLQPSQSALGGSGEVKERPIPVVLSGQGTEIKRRSF